MYPYDVTILHSKYIHAVLAEVSSFYEYAAVQQTAVDDLQIYLHYLSSRCSRYWQQNSRMHGDITMTITAVSCIRVQIQQYRCTAVSYIQHVSLKGETRKENHILSSRTSIRSATAVLYIIYVLCILVRKYGLV